MKKKLLLSLTLLSITLTTLFCSGAKENPSIALKTLRTYTDSFGRTVEIPIEVNSIVSLGPNITETISSLNKEALIARTDYCDYPSSVLSLPSIGSLTNPNIEKIIELNPDLVVASTHVKKEFLDQLSKAGISNVGIYSDNTIEGSFKIVKDLGIFLNKSKKANSIISNMKKEINEIKEAVKDLEKPSVYYVISFGQWGEYTTGGNTFIGQMIDIAGGNNIAKDIKGWNYSLEKLIEADPDIIIISKYWGSKEKFETTMPYSSLRAVKEGHLYEIDNNLLDRQGIRNAEGIKELAKILHSNVIK